MNINNSDKNSNDRQIIQILDYQIIETVYSGSRTLVYRGIRNNDQLPVVIKLLKNDYPTFSELVQFRNQYTIAKNLNSSQILQTYSREPYQNGYALVMEDFGGISLQEWAVKANNALGLREFLEIAITLCNTLDILYRDRIIHKDIKPSNILINPETKQVKLIDFSIASLLPRETQTLINPNVLEGTLAYISPEQTGRMNRGIDYRTDFYSLGVTFYELLTGKLPFQSNDPMELVHCHIAKQPPVLENLEPKHLNGEKIPQVLSDIVSKLMAKNAESRYQSALGLKYDLEKCLTHLQENGQIEHFQIGFRDVCDRFLIPEKLYGRETEVAQLFAAFERVSLGATEIMLVAGFSGIGKTAVINEVHKPIVRQRGYFIKGKYDQLGRNIPFSAFVQAFRDLMGQLLCESDVQLQAWKTKILEVVGDSGQVLIDVIPELERIIGTQSRAAELSGSAAQNRFNRVMQKFVQVFTSPEHPLVMFLDDLQWADSASLKLLQLLMAETGHLLVLGAYRDNEVSPAHPFILTVDEMIETGAVVNTITLQPLSLEALNQLVADTLSCEFLLAQPLTELVVQKTQGNPFFATQFLKALQVDERITFDWSAGHWQCDIAQVRALSLTDNVVEFMALQLQKLPLPTQDVLKLAACIGAQFDLQTLAIVSEKSPEITADDLWKALQEGLIIPNTEIYKFFIESDSASVCDAAANPIYRFLHDRIQQAAYSLIPDAQKQATHLKIGQLLQENCSEIEREEKLFDIVGHLNLGRSLINQPDFRSALAQLNLKAGAKAKKATAYAAASVYCQTGLAILPADCWQTQYELALNLYVAAAEASYLNGDFEGMEQQAALVLQQARTIFDKVKIYEIQIAAQTAQNKMLEAIAAGQNALTQLGIEFSSEPDEALTNIALQTLSDRLSGKQIEELINLPRMSDPRTIAAMQLLAMVFAPIFTASPGLLPLLCSRMVSLSLQFGNAPASTIGYAGYGMVLSAFLPEVEKGYCFGQVALSLLNQLNVPEFKSLTLLWFGVFLQHRQEALRATIPTAKEGYLAGMETGDFLYAGYNMANYFLYNLLAGVYLDDWEPEIENYCVVLAQVKQDSALTYLKMKQQMVHNLREIVSEPDLLIGTAYDEKLMIPKHHQDNQLNALAFVYIYKLMLAYLFGNYTKALDYIAQVNLCLMAVGGTFLTPVFHFYAGLTYLALFATQSEIEQANTLALVETHQTILQNWAHNAPMNHQHKWLLVEAEKCRILGKKLVAIESYDRAIQLAKENQFFNEEALANELAAKFYLEWGKEKVAQAYIIEAYYCYARWGAKAKVVELETRYPQLLQLILNQPKIGLDSLATLTAITHSSTQVSSTTIADSLDFASVIKAAQAISGTIQLDELLEQLVQIILQNSGADKCVLVLPQDGIWQVRAISTLESTELCSESLDDCPHVPSKLIQYVKRMQSVVVIDNLQTDLPVIDDYLTQQQPLSVLCLPILDRGHLAGILYLKNESTAGVFTSSRLTVINFLCTQAAISLENAHLYQQSQIKAQELEESLQCLQHTQGQVQAAQDFLQLAIDNIPQLIFWKDTNSTYLGCNRLFAQAAGLNSVQDIVGKTDYDLPWKKTESDGFRECDRRVMASGIPELGMIENQQQAGGKQTWAETNKVPLRDVHGTTIGILGTYQDITNRQRLEEEKLRLIAILEATSDLVGITDDTGNSLYLNQAGQQLLQIPAAEMNQFHISEAIAPAMLSALRTEILPTAIREGIWSGESILRSRKGEEIPVSQVFMAHKNALGEVEFLSTIVRDIRDFKRIEAERQQKSEALEQALRELQQTQIQLIQGEKMSALGNLVAGVAHEINNPVGFLSGNIQPALDYINDLFGLIDLFKQKYPQLDPEIQVEIAAIELDYIREDLPKLIGSMKEGVKRIREISTSLRTFSRADTDRPVACNIHDGIDSTIMILKHRLKASETRPEIQVIKEYGNLPKIECYAGQLNQVFMNLLANAIDAIEESNQGRTFAEIEAQPNQITIATEFSPQQQAVIRIQDNGKGMTEQVKQKIFDHLFTTKAVGKGTGLGLAIARQIIVEKHRGSLNVNSQVGAGTEFIITLPTQA